MNNLTLSIFNDSFFCGMVNEFSLYEKMNGVIFLGLEMFSRSRKDEVNFEKIEKSKKRIVEYSNVSLEKLCGKRNKKLF